jgi:hypothetical protein
MTQWHGQYMPPLIFICRLQHHDLTHDEFELILAALIEGGADTGRGRSSELGGSSSSSHLPLVDLDALKAEQVR